MRELLLILRTYIIVWKVQGRSRSTVYTPRRDSSLLKRLKRRSLKRYKNRAYQRLIEGGALVDTESAPPGVQRHPTNTTNIIHRSTGWDMSGIGTCCICYDILVHGRLKAFKRHHSSFVLRCCCYYTDEQYTDRVTWYVAVQVNQDDYSKPVVVTLQSQV
jgi:hypothetical protein